MTAAEDGTKVTDARNSRAIQRVRNIHQPYSDPGMGWLDNGEYGVFDGAVCQECGTPDEYAVPWPCPTILALDGTDE